MALALAGQAHGRGVEVLIAGAGAAAHLPGILAAATPLPVIGVPIDATALKGVDALYAMVQMPSGVPVAVMAIGGAKNAALFAVQILGTADRALRDRFVQYKQEMAEEVKAKHENLQARVRDIIEHH
jgi:phosphoribosylaminoimidazole carboxylase PurE protein